MRDDFLDQFYTIDKETEQYIVDISLEYYKNIFNTWDSAVYNLRDLDTSFRAFLEECAYDIALDNEMVIRLNIKNEPRNEELEKTIIDSMRTNFKYVAITTQRQLKNSRKRSLQYVAVSLCFLLLTTLPPKIYAKNIILQVMLQSLTIGGWIFLWEAFSILFIRSSDDREKRKIYRRLQKAPIIFRY